LNKFRLAAEGAKPGVVVGYDEAAQRLAGDYSGDFRPGRDRASIDGARRQPFNWNADNLASTSLGTIVTVETGTTIDTTVKHSGAGSMKLNFPPGDVGSQTQMGVEPGGPIV
jgi:hypothetical protein